MSLDKLAFLKPYFSFLHPIAMAALFVLAIYAMYLGVQARRTRLAGGDLKKQLLNSRFAIRHHQIGAIFLALLVIGAITGITVTYLNNGKIVIASHLFVGLGMVGVVSMSAALVPFMQKQEWVRSIHLLLNLILLGLFGWEGVTGVQIVQKIFSQLMTNSAV